MSGLAAAIVTAAALIAIGLGSLALRRSFAGMVLGSTIGSLGLILAATALFTMTGRSADAGAVIAQVLVAGAVATGVVLLALHLAAARASRRAEDLEPW
jgi:NADH:ubiquinone oxidoreductase subunit K